MNKLSRVNVKWLWASGIVASVLIIALAVVGIYAFKVQKELNGSRLSYKQLKDKYASATSFNLNNSLNFVPVSLYNQEKVAAQNNMDQATYWVGRANTLQSEADDLQSQLTSCQNTIH